MFQRSSKQYSDSILEMVLFIMQFSYFLTGGSCSSFYVTLRMLPLHEVPLLFLSNLCKALWSVRTVTPWADIRVLSVLMCPLLWDDASRTWRCSWLSVSLHLSLPPPPPPHSAAFLRSWNCNRRIKWSANPLLCDFSELFIKSCYMPLYTCSSHKRHKTKQFVSSLSPSLYDAEYTQDKKCTKPKKNGTNWC